MPLGISENLTYRAKRGDRPIVIWGEDIHDHDNNRLVL